MKTLIFLSLLVTTVYAAPPTGRYATILNEVSDLAKQYPDIMSTFSIGTNDDDVEIIAVRVSSNPTQVDPAKIGQLVVSTHHGNELGAPQFTMAFLRDLLERYSSQELYRGNLHDMEFTIIPVLNISGYNSNTRWEHGADPNRDYPSPCTNSPGGKLKSIKNLITLLTTRIFAGSVTVHGYDGSLTYPWGFYTTNTHTHDHNQYQDIFSKAAKHNGYRVGTASDVVYPANGCYEDYVYWKNGSWSLLLELESGGESDIRDTVPAIATFFDLIDSSPSQKNQVTGDCSRAPLRDLRLE